jgi:hypothetical protein
LNPIPNLSHQLQQQDKVPCTSSNRRRRCRRDLFRAAKRSLVEPNPSGFARFERPICAYLYSNHLFAALIIIIIIVVVAFRPSPSRLLPDISLRNFRRRVKRQGVSTQLHPSCIRPPLAVFVRFRICSKGRPSESFVSNILPSNA